MNRARKAQLLSPPYNLLIISKILFVDNRLRARDPIAELIFSIKLTPVFTSALIEGI